MDFMNEYRRWLKYADEETRRELSGITDEREIEERFYKSLKFGTGGLRDILGAGTNRLNKYTVRKATKGFAEFIKQSGEAAMRRGVAIAYDNRRKSRELAENAAGVLAANGIKAYIFDSLRPTPELSFTVRELGCFGGIVITASHNPPEYNGYKLYDETGCQMTNRYTDKIIKLIDAVEDELAVECVPFDKAGSMVETISSEIDERYYEETKKVLFFPEIDKSDLKIVFSPQHGAANVPVRRILSDLGYNIIPVDEQCFPDENFINTKNPNPEHPASFELPIQKAKECGADIIVTTDPDCDRLGAAVLHNGEYIRMTGNQTGAVMLRYILKRRAERNDLPKNGLVFNTVVTSSLGDAIAAGYGVKTEKTLTGFKYIGEKIHEHELIGDGEFMFGYEESYGYLISDCVRDKDAVQSTIMLCEMAAYYKRKGKTLYDVLIGIYDEYGWYIDEASSVKCKGRDGAKKIKEIMKSLREDPKKEIGDIAVEKTEDFLAEEMQEKGFPKSNVLKYSLADGSWVAVRPSGTEPKCKFYYCVRAISRAEAEDKLRSIKRSIEVIK